MSIASLISRFTAPCLFTHGIPTYRHSFSLPIPGTADVSRSDEAATSKAAYVEWSQILPLPSSMLSSFNTLFQGSNPPKEHAKVPKRLTFFGEQHHQPQVMRAQLQTLHALHEQCRQASASDQGTFQLHLVLEHFSVLDQDMLSSYANGKISSQQLADRYASESEEGFQIGRYMPLLMLAKELHVPVWGGFPPRSWARQVFREGIEPIKLNEKQRIETCTTQDSTRLPPCSPLFTSWNIVTRMSAAHRSYLSSLMRPDLPPRFPPLPEDDAKPHGKNQLAHTSAIYPTWLLQPNLVEKKGFGPAQALKDAYLAHVTAWLLRGAPTAGSDPSTESTRRVTNVVLVMCGLGHCEYGFGAPERVAEILEKEPDQLAKAKPYIIASKPMDAGVWLGCEHSLNNSAAQPHIDANTQEAEEVTTENLQAWRNNPWERKLADAVLLYDWMDEGAEQRDGEPETQADSPQQDTHQHT